MSSSSSAKAAAAGFILGTCVTLVISRCLLKAQPKRKIDSKDSESSKRIPAELRDEQLSRHTLYFGANGMKRLRDCKIVVIGLGGVGSHTAHMLARSGVGHLRLIDFDQVSLSSLNRHACATLQDVGVPKATCLKNYCLKLCPDDRYLVIEDVVQMYTADDNGPKLLEGQEWDLVIDAIDDVPTKASLLAHCIKNKLRAVSCMGAGGKSDPTRLHISDLRTASRDPLASKLRQSLKRLLKDDANKTYMDDMDQVSVVYSSEKVVVQLADFTEEQKAEGVHQFGAVDGMRIRILPVLGTMPAIMGQTLAAMALCEVSGKSFSPVTGERVGRNVRNRMFQHLKRRELKIQQQLEQANNEEASNKARMIAGTWVGPVQVDSDDVEYLLEIWRNRCAVTGDRLGTVLELVRWDLTKPSTCRNLVLMSAHALKRFDESGTESVPKSLQRIIAARLEQCRIDSYA